MALTLGYEKFIRESTVGAVASAAAATTTTIAAAIPDAAPAGGTGAAAGAWDTAANRDAAITTINDLRAYAVEQKADFDKIVADVDDIRSKLNSLLTSLRNIKVIAT